MSKILEGATKHFRDKISGDMLVIDVPEWGAKIWFKKSTTLKEESKLIDLAQQNKTVEALVESLVIKARNEDGTKMFSMPDKVVLMNEVDPNVLIRVVTEINSVTAGFTELEEVEKN